MEGKMAILATISGSPLVQELAPNGNTVIHIAAQYGKNEWIQKLLSHMGSSSVSDLLLAVNTNRDTSLHIAAREGHPLVIGHLIGQAKELDRHLLRQAKELDDSAPGSTLRHILTAINQDGDTALHLALRSSIATHFQDVVGPDDKDSGDQARSSVPEITTAEGQSSLDIIAMLVFPNIAYSANKAGETPLYLAAECDGHQLVRKIAETISCSGPGAATYGGPGGRTALHAAVICDNEENTKFLLDYSKKELAMVPDARGWTPLHCAAEFDLAERVGQLLRVEKSLAYLTTTKEEGENTALHIASQQGCVSAVEQLVSQCPGCLEIVNGRAQNALHVAIENGEQKAIEYFEKSSYLGSLINQKDVDGNTPIHLAAKYCQAIRLSNINRLRLLKMSFNEENQTPLDLLAYSKYGSDEEKRVIKANLIEAGLSQVSRNATTVSGKQKKARAKNKKTIAIANGNKNNETTSAEKVEDAESTESEEEECVGGDDDTILVVAALVATVTFTAGITVPGGYNGNEGPNLGAAMLLKDAAFQVFVVADTAAFLLSTLALALYVARKNSVLAQIIPGITHQLASKVTIYSVLAMVMAFITGTYSVLSSSPSLAITLCVITSSYFLFFSSGVFGRHYVGKLPLFSV